MSLHYSAVHFLYGRVAYFVLCMEDAQQHQQLQHKFTNVSSKRKMPWHKYTNVSNSLSMAILLNMSNIVIIFDGYHSDSKKNESEFGNTKFAVYSIALRWDLQYNTILLFPTLLPHMKALQCLGQFSNSLSMQLCQVGSEPTP
jgi:hypothetical protein